MWTVGPPDADRSSAEVGNETPGPPHFAGLDGGMGRLHVPVGQRVEEAEHGAAGQARPGRVVRVAHRHGAGAAPGRAGDSDRAVAPAART